ncbi:LysM domain-containing protein [Beauveria bassiana]|nr:LysM domain-containing protein [Beauveria bassiana]
MMQKLAVAILAFLPLPARANDGLWTNGALWEKVSENPKMPYDPRTPSPCTQWYNNDGTYDCASVVSYTKTDLVWFHRWNPSIIYICRNFQKGQSYCLDASRAEPPATEIFTAVTTLTPTPTHTTNTLITPSPAQPGMDNCNKSYALGCEDAYASVSSLFSVSFDSFIKLIGVASRNCSQLTAQNHVGVATFDEGQRANLASATSSATTSAGNGIQTPQPTQADMVGNCNKFHYIGKGNTCGQITSYHRITQEQFARWNPKIGSNCTSLWPDHYACVGVDHRSI